MRRRVPEDVHAPFERSPAQWRAMGAPSFMWDDEEALRVAREVFPPGLRLEGFGRQGDRLLLRRFRQAVVASVLSRCGQLTAVERAKTEQRQAWYGVGETPTRWLWPLDDVLAGRVR